jgi:galactonate dehydratase
MGPLATAVNVHFCAVQQNFRILEYRLPKGQVYAYGGNDLVKEEDVTRYVVDPYLPKDGYLELRPDRPGWGVEMDVNAMQEDGYVHWQRRVPKRPDGSYAFA